MTEPQEILVRESRIQVPYTWSAGTVGSRFLKALRDERRFTATRCPKCRKAYILPLSACGDCLEDCAEWITVGPQGSLLSFTQALYDSPAHPIKNPLYGLIRLDGADTALLHLVGEASIAELRIGARLEPVFAQSRSGSILDVLYFKPVRGETARS